MSEPVLAAAAVNPSFLAIYPDKPLLTFARIELEHFPEFEEVVQLLSCGNTTT